VNRNDFQEKIGYRFGDPELLDQALTHSSYTRENNLPRAACNERLEFLGDAFFDAIIGEELYRRLPEKKEGCLTKYRALIVCEKSLAETARSIEIGSQMKLGRGEETSGGRERESIIADAMESLIGAVYLDSDYECVKKFVLGYFRERLEQAIAGNMHDDHKSEFQEMAQADGPVKINYELVSEEGPDHDKTFYVRVTVDDVEKGQGKGKSKKEAEQQAAKDAMLRGDRHVL